MSAPCLYGPEPPGEITIDLAGRVPAGLVAAFDSHLDGPTASTSPAAPGRLRTASASVCIRILGHLWRAGGPEKSTVLDPGKRLK